MNHHHEAHYFFYIQSAFLEVILLTYNDVVIIIMKSMSFYKNVVRSIYEESKTFAKTKQKSVVTYRGTAKIK